MVIETPHVLAPCGLMLREGQYIVTEDGVVCSNGGGGEIIPATADTLGGIKVGGSFNITSDGVLTTKLPAPPASPDPTKEYVMKNGEWVESSTAEISPATATTLGGVKIGSSFEMDANDKIQLKAPTGSTLGGVKAGASGNIVIDSNGNISTKIPEAPTNDGKQYIMKGTVDGNGEWVEFVVPIATATTAGGVIVGDGISVGTDGTISADVQEAPNDTKQYVRKGEDWHEFEYTAATATTLGGVKIKADGGIKNESGEISVDKATATALGGVSIPANSGLDLSATGALTLAEATDATLGGVIVDGEGLEVDTDGKIGVNADGVSIKINDDGELYVGRVINAIGLFHTTTGTTIQGSTTAQVVSMVRQFINGDIPFGFGVRSDTSITDPIEGIGMFTKSRTVDTNKYEIKGFVDTSSKQYVVTLNVNTTTGAESATVNIAEVVSGGSDTLIANFTGDGVTATCDKTVAEVWSAISGGKDVRATYNGNYHCYVENASNTSIKFVGIINVQWDETTVPPSITHIRYVECEMQDDHGTQVNKAREYEVAVGGGGVEEPTTDGTFVRKAKTESGTTTYSWVEFDTPADGKQYARTKAVGADQGYWVEISGGIEEPTTDGTHLRKKDGTAYSWQSYTPFTEVQIKGWIDEKIIDAMSAGY